MAVWTLQDGGGSDFSLAYSMIFLIFKLTLIVGLYLEDLIRGRRKKFPTVQFIMKISKVGVFI